MGVIAVEINPFEQTLDLSGFDDYDEYWRRQVCEALMVPAWIWRGYHTKEDYEIAELKYLLQRFLNNS